MKLMPINTRSIHYATYLGQGEPILDDDGYETGERAPQYADPEELVCNVGAVEKGEAWIAVFGVSEDYDRVIVTDDMECPIDENTVLWVDVSPEDDTPYDYTVWRVSRYLNHIAYAVKKVKVT